MNPPHDPLDRRPIKTRSAGWARALAHALATRKISANFVSGVGMLFGIAAGVLLLATGEVSNPVALRLAAFAAAACIQLRLMCNMLDGMVAVETQTTSPVGALYNEIPDRISDACTLIGAGYALGGCAAMGYAAAVLAIFVAYVRAMGTTLGQPNDFCGPMAKPHRMFTITLFALYLALAPASWRVSWGPSGAWGMMAIGLLIVAAGSAWTALRRLRRLAAALRRTPA